MAPPSTRRRDEPGIVSLVGAGPGDPELITLKGLRRLRAAQVVVHDALIGQELLEECRPDAEIRRKHAGKRAGGPTRRQEWIHRPAGRAGPARAPGRAPQGRRPLHLRARRRGGRGPGNGGVVWEVVPGVSAAIAAPAYAGIPLTHRTHAASFAVVTGHEPTDLAAGSRLRWEALARDVPTAIAAARQAHPSARMCRPPPPLATTR